MADAAYSIDGQLTVNVLEHIAFELRTQNLIQYIGDNGAVDPLYGQVMTEIRTRLGLSPVEETDF